MAAKTLSVLGSDGVGKKTLIGSLIYKCGLDLPQLEELEREGVRQFAEVVPFYERRGRIPSFHAPSGPFVVEKSQTPDVAFWVVDATNSATWSLSVQKLGNSLSSGVLQPRNKLVIVINKMDLVNWSEGTFEEAARKFGSLDLRVSVSTHIIPISGLQGDNILATPQGPSSSWIKDVSASRAGGPAFVSGEALMNLLQ